MVLDVEEFSLSVGWCACYIVVPRLLIMFVVRSGVTGGFRHWLTLFVELDGSKGAWLQWVGAADNNLTGIYVVGWSWFRECDESPTLPCYTLVPSVITQLFKLCLFQRGPSFSAQRYDTNLVMHCCGHLSAVWFGVLARNQITAWSNSVKYVCFMKHVIGSHGIC